MQRNRSVRCRRSPGSLIGNEATDACVGPPLGSVGCNDNNACTTGDTCVNGTCTGGPAPNCNDGSLCTTDSCDQALGCRHAPVAAGTQCRPLGGPCDDADT